MSVEWIIGLGIVVLGVIIFWGMRQSQKRNRANDKITAAATRELSRDPDGYAADKKQALDEQIKP